MQKQQQHQKQQQELQKQQQQQKHQHELQEQKQLQQKQQQQQQKWQQQQRKQQVFPKFPQPPPVKYLTPLFIPPLLSPSAECLQPLPPLIIEQPLVRKEHRIDFSLLMLQSVKEQQKLLTQIKEGEGSVARRRDRGRRSGRGRGRNLCDSLHRKNKKKNH